jgi:hypothetical protein
VSRDVGMTTAAVDEAAVFDAANDRILSVATRGIR